MRIGYLITPILLFLSATVYAQSDENVAVFNSAWREYQAALQSGDSDSQIETSGKVLELGRRILDESDDRLPLLMVHHGKALLNGDQSSQADIVLSEAIELAEKIHGKNSLQLVPVLTEIAKVDDGRDGGKRRRLFSRAIAIAADASGKDSDAVSALKLEASGRLYGTDEWDAGRRYANDAYKHYQRTAGDQSFNTGVAAFYQGKYAFSAKKFRAATEHLLIALAAFNEETSTSIQYQLHTRALLVASLENRGQTEEATEHCVAIGQLSGKRDTSDFQPLFRMAPTYPQKMLTRNRQGHVDLSFTVDELGFVQNPEVINEGDDAAGFETAAIEAAKAFRYAPQFEDGKAVAVNDVKTRITFKLER